MKKRLNNHAGVLALAALVVSVIAAISGVAVAATLITGANIKNNTITTQDLKNNGVKSTDIRTGTIASSDIGNGDVASADIGNGDVAGVDIGANQVEPTDVDLPESEQVVEAPKDAGSATVGATFVPVDNPAATYVKEAAESQLEITWTGTAVAAGTTPKCVFQLRVDGNPATVGAGEAFAEGQARSVAVTAVFAGLAVGPHTIEIWAKSLAGESVCTVGPAELGIDQTFVIAENVS